ncbi:MAG: ATP synthase F1 subunit gamma [bacterium]|nr:ATP synthase F1 subunit gamma [bacterium]
MPNLRDIKRRITSVKNTQKITRAMKMVAAAKLRRAQEAIQQARPYAYHMRDLVNRLALRVDETVHPLLGPGRGDVIHVVVVTADRGLCGGFNSNLINETMRVVGEQFPGEPVEITVIGRKGRDAFKRRTVTVREVYTDVMDPSPWRSASEIVGGMVDEFVAGRAKAVYCLYNEFKSAISQHVTLEKLLPFDPPDRGEIVIDYVYEPAIPEVVGGLLSRHMQIQMHRILFESAASEYGARMTAMDSATNNAGDVIDRLTLKYNRARQDTITREMIEIVSGAEAL